MMPAAQLRTLSTRCGCLQIIHWIRHGEGWHNIGYENSEVSHALPCQQQCCHAQGLQPLPGMPALSSCLH